MGHVFNNREAQNRSAMSQTDMLPAGRAENEPFWDRVRAALGGLRPLSHAEIEPKPAYGKAAIARSLGMKPRLSAMLEEELVTAWHSAGAQKVSLSLLVIEVDRFGDYFNAYGRAVTDDCLKSVLHTINAMLPRAQDKCHRLGRNQFVVVLPDYPLLMARVTAQKIAAAIQAEAIVHKESHAGVVTASIGLAVANPSGQIDKRFLEAGVQAQAKAARRGLNRIEAVDLRKAKGKGRKAA